MAAADHPGADAGPAAGTTTAPRTGWRERKKQQTREALSWAALRLAVERGLENVRVEDIAAEAGVSPRTFNNYFSSKQEAVVCRQTDRVRQAADALRRRPPDEPLWQAVDHVAQELFADSNSTPDARWTRAVSELVNHPSLRGAYLKGAAAAEQSFAAAVAERTGGDPERDLYPKLVAAVFQTALRVAADQWLRADPPTPMRPLLREAVQLLAAGLPEPAARPAGDPS